MIVTVDSGPILLNMEGLNKKPQQTYLCVESCIKHQLYVLFDQRMLREAIRKNLHKGCGSKSVYFQSIATI